MSRSSVAASAGCAQHGAWPPVVVPSLCSRRASASAARCARTRSAGHHADLGAHWIGPTQDRIAALARELGVRCRAAAPGGTGGARVARPPAHVPRLPPTAFAIGHRRARRRPASARPAPAPSASRAAMDPRDSHRLGSSRPSKRSRGATARTTDARLFLNLATELVFGAEPEELSLLYFLFYLQSGGGLTSLTEFEGGAQQDHFVGGSQQICDRLAERLGDAVRFRTRCHGRGAGRRPGHAAHRGRQCGARSARDRRGVAGAGRALALGSSATRR